MTRNYQNKEYQSMRLLNYDYRTAGAYAITICAQERWRCLFSLPELDGILKQEWEKLSQHITDIKTDLIVIMPDHLHCILWQFTQRENIKSTSDIIRRYKSVSANAWIKHLKASDEEYPYKI